MDVKKLSNLPTDPSFEKQFEEKALLQTAYGIIETVDATPPVPKESVPVLFAPGWRETPELEKVCLQEVYASGRRVVTLRHTPVIYGAEADHNLPVIEVQKAKTLLTVIDEKSMEQVDIITHSEGAINVAIAATMQSEKFRHLVLVTPAGLGGKSSIPQISFGFARHIARSSSQIPRIKAGLMKKSHHVEATVLNSIKTTLQEGAAIASFDIFPLLMELRAQGIKIAVLFGERDTVFPIRKVRRHLTRHMEQLSGLSPYTKKEFGFDIFATKPGGHELYTNSHQIMQQVLELLDALSARDLHI
jgi:pimeloyl-ACP methyl ester carboxylesterase